MTMQTNSADVSRRTLLSFTGAFVNSHIRSVSPSLYPRSATKTGWFTPSLLLEAQSTSCSI